MKSSDQVDLRQPIVSISLNSYDQQFPQLLSVNVKVQRPKGQEQDNFQQLLGPEGKFATVGYTQIVYPDRTIMVK